MAMFLRLPSVQERTGLSRATIYAMARAHSFPAQVRIGARAVAWVLQDIEQWEAKRIAASKAPSPSKAADLIAPTEARL